jgi:hypothetical protein
MPPEERQAYSGRGQQCHQKELLASTTRQALAEIWGASAAYWDLVFWPANIFGPDDPKKLDSQDADAMLRAPGPTAGNWPRSEGQAGAAATAVQPAGPMRNLGLKTWNNQAELIDCNCQFLVGILVRRKYIHKPRRWATRRSQEYPVRSLDRESRSPRHHRGHRRPRWTYTTNALPMNAQRWYAMGASDNTCSLPILQRRLLA